MEKATLLQQRRERLEKFQSLYLSPIFFSEILRNLYFWTTQDLTS